MYGKKMVEEGKRGKLEGMKVLKDKDKDRSFVAHLLCLSAGSSTHEQHPASIP